MRSAVSAILSEPLDQSPMAFPDYAQTASDHRRALVLVSQLGSRINQKLFQRVVDRISKVQRIAITDNNGGSSTTNTGTKPRQFYTRYLSKAYPVENNDWGEFQFHRSLLGLINVGCYSTTQELSELTRLHDATKAKYTSTLLDTRLVAIGVAPSENGEHPANNSNSNDDYSDENNPPGSGNGSYGGVLFYQSSNFEETLEADLVEFLTSLYWVLELRRREFLKEKLDGRIPFLCAPFEKKDFVGLDLESRTNRKRTFGRHRKHVADLCLLCDCLTEAQQFYEIAAEILRSCNDWIWLAGALEGLCAVSVIILFPRIQRNSVTTQRNNSYNVLSSSGQQNHHLRPPSNGKPFLSDDDNFPAAPKSLASNDIIDKYKEAVLHYGKYRHAGVIETEASIKAVQVLTEQKNYLMAAEFLQNIVFINLQMNDDEKIQRFSSLAKLYQNIGFHRKCAFFLRVSAMRCVAPQNQHPDWGLCYQLLLKTTSGYQIDLNNTFVAPKETGWPTIQIQVLQELVGTARRMGNHAASTHHMTYLLECMFDHLSTQEKLEFCTQLSALTSRQNGSETPVILDNGLLLPPIGMYKIPKVTSFEPIPLPAHLEPRRDKNSRHHKKDSGVFFFTPIQFGGKSGDPSMVAFKWVEGDVAEVSLTIFNPLPTEIKLVNLALLHEGIEFETFPSALSLAASSGPHKVSLLGVPKGTGVLKILGYTCTVLGVKSTCKLARIKTEKSEYSVTVLPSMPQLGVKIKHLNVADVENDAKSVTFDAKNDASDGKSVKSEDEEPVVRLHDGETANFEISLTNVSNRSASKVLVMCNTFPTEYNSIVSLNGQIARLEPGETCCVKAMIRARRLTSQFVTQSSSLTTNSCDNVDGGKWGILSRLDPTRWSGASKKSVSSRETVSGDSNKSSGTSRHVPKPIIVTLNFKVIYSGGAACEQGYQRELTKTLTVEIVPSAVVTKWDVLPADKVNENYLVLDISNVSEHEMDLRYCSTKSLTIEQGDVCRIPIPVTKFDVGTSAGASIGVRQKICSEYLEKIVQIEWTIARLNRSGHLSLHAVTLDAEMISSLEHCPVEWSVSVDGADGSDVASISLGHSVDITMTIRSGFDFEIRGEFRIDCYFQGQRCNDVSDALVMMTQCESEGQACSPGGQLSHSTCLLPLASGSYELVITCTLEKTGSLCHSETPFSFISKYPKLNIVVNDEMKQSH